MAEIPGNGGKTDTTKHYEYDVSEGSSVILDARDFLPPDEINIDSSYSWTPLPTDARKENSTLSFTAPYVKGDGITKRLSFELTIKDKSGKTRDPYNVNVVVKRVHRAIIFQGGAALGAYEAGVYKAIVEKLVKNDEDRKRKGLDNEKRPLFDIVAGTSIGAMNGAIVVSYVTKDKCSEDPKAWQDSAEKVKEFWRVQKQFPTVADFLDMNPVYRSWWDILHKTNKVFKHSANELIELYSNMNPTQSYIDMLTSCLLLEPSIWKDYFIDSWYIPASAEARRRYYSANQLHRWPPGPFNVASGFLLPWWSVFGKFFDISEQSNWMPRPDNKHYVLFSLKRTLERFVRSKIKTSPKTREPRLLLVTVDVRTGDAVTFDSYSEEAKYHDNKTTISSQDGIEIEHALASGTFPDFFDYPRFKVKSTEMDRKSEERIFWDGGYRSNTPLREVIQAHRDYWHKKMKQDYVPDLEVYIADLWPSELKENPISFDHDFVEKRKWDLILGDKTDYDEQVASVVTDYVNLARRLKDLAKQKGATKEIEGILNSYATSINTEGKRRENRELLEGRFSLTKVVHIDHKDDGNEVHDKVFDYSYKTIEELMETGYRDAIIQMDIQQVKDEVIELAKRNGGWDNIQELEESLNQIQESTEYDGYGNHTIIKQKVRDFISTVERIGEVLPEEKTPLIAAARQLQDTITVVQQERLKPFNPWT